MTGHPDDILGDGSVMKSIIEEGEDPPVYPIFGDECVTHFVGTLPDGTVFNDTMKRDQPFKYLWLIGMEMRDVAMEKALYIQEVKGLGCSVVQRCF